MPRRALQVFGRGSLEYKIWLSFNQWPKHQMVAFQLFNFNDVNDIYTSWSCELYTRYMNNLMLLPSTPSQVKETIKICKYCYKLFPKAALI